MGKKIEKASVGKPAKKLKKGEESLDKELDLKNAVDDVDSMGSDEDLLLIEDDEFVASTEEMDEDVEFLMNAVVDGKGPKSADESAMMSAAELAQQDNAKSAFEGITASSLKNFRHHPDIENFYRFVFDNDLRIEALSILDENIAAKKIRKALKDKKEKVH